MSNGRAGFITHHSSLIALALAVVAAVALLQSWNRWLDPIIDVGRDLYIPGELLDGRKLYRDIYYVYPPLAPYALAGFTWVFGNSLFAFTIFGIAVSAAVAAALWWIGRCVGDELVGATAAFLFLTLSFTGATTWGCNFIFPYAHAATIGTALLLFSGGWLLRALFSQHRATQSLILAGGLGILAAWIKQEFAIVVAGVFAVVVLRYRLSRAAMSILVAAAAVSLLLVWCLFSDSPPGQHWLSDQVLAPSLVSADSGQRFYSAVGGTADAFRNLVQTLLSAALLSLLVLVLRILDRRQPHWIRSVLFVAAAAAILTAIVPDALFRSWAALQFALLPMAWRDRDRPLLILLLLAGLSTFRILLRVSPEWYGFFLTVPAYLAVVYTLIRYLSDKGVYSRRAALLWLPVFFIVGCGGLWSQRQAYAQKKFLISTPRGNFYDVNPDRAAILTAAIQSLVRSGARALLVLPEGATLNYFTALHNPTPFYLFTPPELPPKLEKRAIAAIENSPPDRVVLLTRDMSEFGSRGFGVDYGQELLQYVLAKYQVERQWASARFTLVILSRRSEAEDRDGSLRRN